MANKRDSGLSNLPRERLSRSSRDEPKRPRAQEAPREIARPPLSRRMRGDSGRMARWVALGVMGVLGAVALAVALGLSPHNRQAQGPAPSAPAASAPVDTTTTPPPAAATANPPAAEPPAPPAQVANPVPSNPALEQENKRLQQEVEAEAQRLQALHEQTARAKRELDEARRRAARSAPAPAPVPVPAQAVAPAEPIAPPAEGAPTLDSTLRRLRQLNTPLDASPADASSDSPAGVTGRSPPPGFLDQQSPASN